MPPTAFCIANHILWIGQEYVCEDTNTTHGTQLQQRTAVMRKSEVRGIASEGSVCVSLSTKNRIHL